MDKSVKISATYFGFNNCHNKQNNFETLAKMAHKFQSGVAV